MSTPYRCGISIHMAPDAPVGLVLRTGPKDWMQTILWDTSSDQFGEGQWLHGRVVPKSVSLSPDGTLMTYAASRRNPCDGAGLMSWFRWRVVSKTPWLTALILVESSDAAARAEFLDDDTIVIGRDAPDHILLPPRGDVLATTAVIPLPADRWRCGGRYSLHQAAETLTLVAGTSAENVEVRGVQWSAWDQRGRLVIARGCRLLTAEVVDGSVRETELANFDDGRHPDPRSSPEWAQQW